jgi:DNA-binding LytR/AlgR family response regulator
MKKMHIAICDDEADILSVVTGAIENTFRKYDIEAITEMFKQTKNLEHRMQEQEFELIFLDIEMPGTDGITFAKKLRGINSRTDIIFISNREYKVFDALRVNPAGFIRKRKFLEDVPAVIDQWMQNRKESERSVLLAESVKGTVSVPIDTILYIEGNGRYQEIYCSGMDEPVRIKSTMMILEDNLLPKGFLRIHKGYLVNYRYIKRLKDTDAVLTNGQEIPMSRLRVQEIRNQYLELMQDGANVIL